MPCRQDIKQAILENVFSELTNNRYTFTRIANDTIQVNGKVDNINSKVNHQAQAMAIAKELVNRTEQSFNSHVKGEINQQSAYDPITVKFTPSEAYINHEYQKIPPSQRTDAKETDSLERSHILTDTGHNTYEQLYLFAPTVASIGAYAKMVTFKENQLSTLRNNLRQNQAEQKAKNISDTKLLELKRKERDLRLKIEGNYEKNIEGLVQEIDKLKKESNTGAIAYYVQKDLDRLSKLSESEDLNDLKDAQSIVEFYDAAGTFIIGRDNPFFLPEEIFLDNGQPITSPTYQLTSDYRQSDSVMQQYRDWRSKAKEYENILEDKRRRKLVDEVNADYGVKNTFKGRQFSFEDLVKGNTGLKDTDWFSMWTMDITTGVWSHNGLLPQVMYSKFTQGMEEKEAWSRNISKKIDEISPKVQQELSTIDSGKYSLRGVGILGLKGASYQLYKEVTKDGNETGGLVQRNTYEYNDAENRATYQFWKKFKDGRELADPVARAQAINKAFDELKRWKRNNSIIIDITKLTDIAADPRFTEFNATADPSYEADLIKLLGKKGFQEQVDNQKSLLRRYQTERQAYEEGLLIEEGKNPGDTLSQKGQSSLSYWESNHHPVRAVEDYKSVKGLLYGGHKANNFMDFNTFVARKYKPSITANLGTDEYDFADTTDETGSYDANFAKIESNPTLSQFYDLVREVSEKIRDSVPYDIQEGMGSHTLPGLSKVSTELISDKNLGMIAGLSLAFRHLMDRIRSTFGVIKQSEISYAIKDPITGEENYKISDSFLTSNSRAIKERNSIEEANFLQLFNTGNTSNKLSKINKTSSIRLSSMNPSSVLELAKFLHIEIPFDDIKAGRISSIKSRLEAITNTKTGAIVDYNVPIGKFIYQYSVHTIVQTQSFDLPKLAKYFSNMTMAYAARQEALPLLEIMKHYYESIKKPGVNNLGTPRFNAREKKMVQEGVRTGGIKQMEDYWKRVVLDNYGGQHFGAFGEETALEGVKNNKIDKEIAALESQKGRLNGSDTKYKDNLDKINAKIAALEANKIVPIVGKTIYTKEERDKLGEIQRILSKEKYGDEKLEDLQKLLGTLQNKRIPGYVDTGLEEDIVQVQKIIDLRKIQEGLGKTRVFSNIIEGLLAWTRTLRLGYNVASALTNFMDGVTSNLILGADGSYFDSKEIFYAYGVAKASFLKNITGGKVELPVAKKCRLLADMFKVVIDSTNELQKSSHQSISDKLSILNPHDLNRRTEYLNQTPIMVAMLRTLKIQDQAGNSSSVWDAYGYGGRLKSEFRTQKNTDNWENLEGEDYTNFKNNLNKAIGIGHGLGYDEMRGMMAKSSTAGKAVMMFKTWIPSALYWRFALSQEDIQQGKEAYKGRYRSYSKTGAALHGAIVGAVTFGPVGAAILGGLGFAWGHYGGVDTGIDMIKQTKDVAIQLFKKSIGMPVNLIIGKEVIGQGNDAFNDWIGKGKFTAQDAMNLRANMSDLAIQLMWLALILMTKALLWDDDDDPKSTKRWWHNVFANKFAQMGSQAAMYVNPVDTYKNTLGSLATLEYLKDLGKEVTAFEKWSQGKDIISTGINAGESRLFNQTKKLVMPGIFNSPLSLGFERLGEQEFTPSPYQHLFQGGDKKDKLINQGMRAERKKELESQISLDSIMTQLDDSQFNSKEEKLKAAKDVRDKQIKSILDTELPTPARLKKYGVTRDEYEEYLEQQNQSNE